MIHMEARDKIRGGAWHRVKSGGLLQSQDPLKRKLSTCESDSFGGQMTHRGHLRLTEYRYLHYYL